MARSLSSVLFVLPLLLQTACANQLSSTSLANPAAEFCVTEGGSYEIDQQSEGAVGYCTLPDGTRVDAWDYFRANAPG